MYTNENALPFFQSIFCYLIRNKKSKWSISPWSKIGSANLNTILHTNEEKENKKSRLKNAHNQTVQKQLYREN